LLPFLWPSVLLLLFLIFLSAGLWTLTMPLVNICHLLSFAFFSYVLLWCPFSSFFSVFYIVKAWMQKRGRTCYTVSVEEIREELG
jgi:hypothetical protein